MVVIMETAFMQTGFAQQDYYTHQAQASALLPLYYNVKDALVGGNATIAALKAAELVNALNGAEAKNLSGTNRGGLLEQAGKIAQSKNLKSQREHFAILSEDMVVLAKGLKLSTEPVYQMYCPMKKGSWLSNSATVKNPYFGNAMLSCGTVIETIK